jgi:hypothetical protein
MKILDAGKRIFVISGQETKKLEREKHLEHTDNNSALLVQELAKTHPELFKELTALDQSELKRNYIVGKYRQYTQIIVGLKNRQHAIEKEYGLSEGFSTAIKNLESDKYSQIKTVLPYIAAEREALKDVPGLGPAYIAQICALAHPARFTSVNAYLKYLGLLDRNSVESKHKYNRAAKTVYYQAFGNVLKLKNGSELKDLYYELNEKEKLKTCGQCEWTFLDRKNKSKIVKCDKHDEHPTDLVCKNKAFVSARNKIMTKLAKTVYFKLHNVPISNVKVDTIEEVEEIEEEHI